jgi:stage V sporulation protein B
MATKKKDGFMIQAAILAAAGLLSRVIGLLYAVPLYQIIGEEGNGYYGTAYDIYFMILLISTYSIPTAVSKVISQRLALEEYKNARKLFICSLIYVVVVGAFMAVLTFALAPVLVIDQSVLALRVMAPTIFFSGLLSVFRGYMQAQNTMVPTAISQIIEQIMNAVVSVAAAYIFTLPYRDAMNEGAGELATLGASHGAAGSALGTGAGVLAGLIFILINYARRHREFKAKVDADINPHEESYRDLFKIIFMMVTPVILATFIYNVSTTIDMKIYWWIVDVKGIGTSAASKTYGIYSRQFLVLINLPIAISSAVSAALIPGISGAYSRNDMDGVRSRLNQAIRTTMMVVIPAAFGMAALANPIMQLLFSGTDKRAGYALAGGCVSVIFYALSTITNGVLQGMGRVEAPVKNAALALVVHVVFVLVMLYFTPGTLSVLVAGSVVYSLCMCLFNGYSIRKYTDYRMDYRRIFVMPGISALIMAVAAYLVYDLVHVLVHSNIISLVVAIILAVMVYALMMLKTGACTREDLLNMPKGTVLVRAAEKLHLLR